MQSKLTPLAAASVILALLIAPAVGANGWVAKRDSVKRDSDQHDLELREPELAKLETHAAVAEEWTALQTQTQVDVPPPVDSGPSVDAYMPPESPDDYEGHAEYGEQDSQTSCAGCGAQYPCESGMPCTNAYCYPSGGVYAGTAIVFAKPYFTDGMNYFKEMDTGQGGQYISEPFSYDYEPSFRIWGGYVGPCGFGMRARWWQFDHAGAPVEATVPVDTQYTDWGAQVGSPWDGQGIHAGPGQNLYVFNDLRVDAIDLELTQRINCRRTCVTASGGLRYARTAQGFFAEVAGGEGPPSSLSAFHSFEGVGPTVAVELRRPVGCRGLAVFGGARGSVLFGETHIRASGTEGEIGYQNTFAFSRNADDVMGIGEVEIGLEWSRQIGCRGVVFVRSGYEGQLWHNAGSPSFISGDLGFEGFSAVVGIGR